MARRGYCASCGKDVWLGRDGGCQFGHPASDLSKIHDADPAAVKAAAAQAAASPIEGLPPMPAKPWQAPGVELVDPAEEAAKEAARQAAAKQAAAAQAENAAPAPPTLEPDFTDSSEY